MKASDNKKPKVVYVCSECGDQSPKWVGQCPSCGAWNTLEELVQKPELSIPQTGGGPRNATAVPMNEVALPNYLRSRTGMGELDRVLGGGLVSGSVVLLCGEPGIGKSTLLLQISDTLARKSRVLYVSGEESEGQLKLRADRLHISADGLLLLTETHLESIMLECDRIAPDVIIVDSVQTLFSERSSSAPGSVSQVKECAMSFIARAKTIGCAVLLVGHVTKDGGISGPKILEHMVDAVLSFEGERRQSCRIIRALKNRFGSTNEIGVFEMTDRGLIELPDPSSMVLETRCKNISGSCIGCVMEGTRPIITEIQTLVTRSVFPAPRRTADGFDYNRTCLLIAVLEKRLGMNFSEFDVYLNVAGGLRLDEPAADLSIAMALISGVSDRLIPETLIAFGEIGLGGEVRAVSHAENRVREAIRMGFKTIVMPKGNEGVHVPMPDGVRAVAVHSIFEVLPLMAKAEKQ